MHGPQAARRSRHAYASPPASPPHAYIRSSHSQHGADPDSLTPPTADFRWHSSRDIHPSGYHGHNHRATRAVNNPQGASRTRDTRGPQRNSHTGRHKCTLTRSGVWFIFGACAVGCAAAAGAVLILVGAPLLSWARKPGDLQHIRTAQAAQSGAVGGAVALFVPCGPFLWDAWYFHPTLRLTAPRAHWINVLLYAAASVCFALGVGVWAAIIPVGARAQWMGEDTREGQSVADSVAVAMLGLSVLYAGRAVLNLAVHAVRYVPRGVEEVELRAG